MTRLNKLAVLSAMALFSVGGAQANTLDLVCSAQKRAPIRFRLDTQQQKWCLDECESVWAIDKLSDSQIELSLRTQDNKYNWLFYIDRFTLKWWVISVGNGYTPQDSGLCKVEPFSGFPSKKF